MKILFKILDMKTLWPRTWHLRAFIVSYRFWNCLKISYRSQKCSSKLSNIVSVLIIGWWNYRVSYCVLKALSAITGATSGKYILLSLSWFILVWLPCMHCPWMGFLFSLFSPSYFFPQKNLQWVLSNETKKVLGPHPSR